VDLVQFKWPNCSGIFPSLNIPSAKQVVLDPRFEHCVADCQCKRNTKPAISMPDTGTLTDARWAALLPRPIFGRSQVRTSTILRTVGWDSTLNKAWIASFHIPSNHYALFVLIFDTVQPETLQQTQ
jgi:hypothetical protein